ncbi:MAG TPA: ComEC/Rec2 family competence protein [Nocardioides sp.]|nr:ComEC/Rec2 family competence protein [Nocardioides sp.]
MDLRLVPAAAAAWLACAVGVGLTPEAARGWAVGLLAVAVVAAVVGLAVGVGAVRGAAELWATGWLAVVAAAVALGSCAAQLHARDAGLLAELVAQRATVTVTGIVRSEPVVVAGRWDHPRVRQSFGVHEVVGRGSAGTAAAAVVVIADEGLPYGARVRVTGRLAPAAAGDEAVGVLRATGDPVLVAPPGRADRIVGVIRAALLDVTDRLPPDQRGLVPGVAVGDTSRLPADLDTAMRDVGLTHITAVSGGHFAVLATTVLAAAAALRVPRRPRALVTAVAMGAFVLLVHPDPSVVRAAVMGGVSALGMLLGRPSRTLPALAAGVLGLVVVDPWLARSLGFVLSVLATAGIATLAPVIAGWLSALPRWLAVAIAVPTAAQAVCGPVLVLVDPAVSPYAVPANLLAAPALLPATVLGVGAAVIAPVSVPVGEVLAQLSGAAAWWIAGVARAVAALPGARYAWRSGVEGALTLALLTVALLLVVPAARRYGRRAVVGFGVAGLIALLPVGRQLVRPWPPGEWRVVACDVGQGDALVVRSGPSAAVVVDTGPPGDAAGQCLDRLGVARIDLLVLTHFHDDHVGGLPAVLEGREVRSAIVSPLAEPAAGARAATEALAAAGVPVRAVTAGSSDASGAAGEVLWTVLSPTRRVAGSGDSDVNDASLVLLIDVGELTVVALGDAEPRSQDALAARLLRQPGLIPHGVDVLKVAHHGSAHQSPDLTALLAARVALVSVGVDNDYGHPDEATLAALAAAGALVLATSTCGPVAVGIEDTGLAVWAGCLGDRR